MVVGIDIFKEFFEDFSDHYIIIGGTACDIIIEGEAFTPRATDDIDLVLIIEALTTEFSEKFWEFIKEGEYQTKEYYPEKKTCYRFEKPSNKMFPKQIELFSKVPDEVFHNKSFHLTPIPTEEGVSNLSAILLDEDYYEFTINHSDIQGGLKRANIKALIVLKAFAFLDNKRRKDEGQDVKRINIVKHKNDVFRMLYLLPSNANFELPKKIESVMIEFYNVVKNEIPSPDIFKIHGFEKIKPEILLEKLTTCFNLNE
jgi:hypothetical protein